MKFNYLQSLYRRNNLGKPTIWHAAISVTGVITIYHGILGKTIHEEIINTHRASIDEVNTRIRAKRNIGYKYLNELKDNDSLPVEGELLDYLNKYLPIYRTNAEGNVLPMLAKVYNNSNNRLFNKSSYYLGQYKINGLRCFISAIRNNGDLFKPIKLLFQSREGNYWNSLSNLEDYLLNTIEQKFLIKMIDENYILDGEIYLPGYTVNQINHFVKDSNCSENKLLQYWSYDIAIEDTIQYNRNNILIDNFIKYHRLFNNKDFHLNNTNRLVILPTFDISNAEQAIDIRDKFINLGFEGLMLRNPNSEYQYGKRNLSMIKYKSSTDGKFTIIDIYSEGIKRPEIPLFLCKNDINNETFEVHVGGSHEYQKQCLINKDKYIGKNMYIEYGERSGVNSLPFHIKEVMILD